MSMGAHEFSFDIELSQVSLLATALDIVSIHDSDQVIALYRVCQVLFD